jgi:hypothetical protein
MLFVLFCDLLNYISMSDDIASSCKMMGLEEVPDTSQKYYCLGQFTLCNLVSAAQLCSELNSVKNGCSVSSGTWSG